MSTINDKTCKANRKQIYGILDSKPSSKVIMWGFALFVSVLGVILLYQGKTLGDIAKASGVNAGNYISHTVQHAKEQKTSAAQRKEDRENTSAYRADQQAAFQRMEEKIDAMQKTVDEIKIYYGTHKHDRSMP